MKVAAIADVHAHNYREFDHKTEVTGSHRLDMIVETLDFVKTDMAKRGITTLLIAGDLFHIRGKINTIVYNAVHDKIKEFVDEGIEIIAIPGNHDDHDNSDLPPHSLHALKDVGVKVIDTLNTIYLSDGTPLVCVRYSKNTEMIMDFLTNLDYRGFEKKPMLMAHLGITGGLIGSGSYPMADAFSVGDLMPTEFNHVILGHFHRRQTLGGYKHVQYLGAPIQHSFSDEGEDKGYTILDTDSHEHEFVPIPNPKFVTVRMSGLTEDILINHLESSNYIRALLTSDEVEQFKQLVPEGLHYKIILEKEFKEETRIDVKVGMTEEQVVTTYANTHYPEALGIGLKILAEVKGNV